MKLREFTFAFSPSLKMLQELTFADLSFAISSNSGKILDTFPIEREKIELEKLLLCQIINLHHM